MNRDKIRQGLETLAAQTPEKKNTKKEIVQDFGDDIRRLREAGHSYDAIVKALEASGVSIKETTLKKYLTKPKDKSAEEETKTIPKKRKKKTTSSPTPESQEANAAPGESAIPNTASSPKEGCPRCGKKLVYRKGPKGEFVGCTGYPGCNYTHNA